MNQPFIQTLDPVPTRPREARRRSGRPGQRAQCQRAGTARDGNHGGDGGCGRIRDGTRVSAFTVLQVSSPVSYLIAIMLPLLDAVFPVLPSETLIIALGVATAGSTDPRIALLVACAAFGAFLGDNLSYFIGSRFGAFGERRFFSSEKGRERKAWAERELRRFGIGLILVCRFIPGGRTAVTLCCGLIGYPRRRFVVATALAASVWALYAFFAGRIGGQAFEDKPWLGFLVAFGAATAITGIVTVIRRMLSGPRSS